MEDYLGVIRLFSGNFIPKGWMPCDGRILDITKYTALYSIIGNIYGGDGIRQFAIPNLCGRIPIGSGTSAKGDDKIQINYKLAEKAGEEKTTLSSLNIPSLKGGFVDWATLALPCISEGNENDPNDKTMGGNSNTSIFSSSDPDKKMKPFKINEAMNDHIVYTNVNAEGVVPFNNIQPVLGISYIICYSGLFPEREL